MILLDAGWTTPNFASLPQLASHKALFSLDKSLLQVNACIATGPEIVKTDVKETLQSAGKDATATMDEANKCAAGIEDLYLNSKKGVTKMDEEIKDFQDKLRKKGEKISEAKRILNEKCIEQCSTGLCQKIVPKLSFLKICS